MRFTEERLRWFIIGGLISLHENNGIKLGKRDFKKEVDKLMKITTDYLNGGHLVPGHSNIYCYIALDAKRVFIES